MGRVKKKKKYNFYSRMRNHARREFFYSPLRKQAMDRARIARGQYQCEKCSKVVGPKEIQIDHLKKVTPLHGLQSLDDLMTLIKNMHECGLEGLMALCEDCHHEKTNIEKDIVKRFKAALKNNTPKE